MYKPCLLTDSWQYNVCDSLLNFSTATRKGNIYKPITVYDRIHTSTYNTESL